MRRTLWALAMLALLCATLLTGADLSARQTASSDPSRRFGVVEPHDAPADAAELGVGWGRARFHWASVQPNGPNDWVEAELTSAELDNELAAGREVVGLLIGIPDWAKDTEGLPAGLYLLPDDRENLWANYVREAVTRYSGKIDHWIIWNEPDIWDETHVAFAWPGDTEDYIQLLRIAYITAHDANPDAVIHLAAVSHWWDVQHGRELYFPQLLDAIISQPDAAEYNYFYDVATMHLYFNPASVFQILTEYQGYQSDRGLGKPFWLVETNAATSQDPAWPVPEPTFQVSLLEQAAYQPQGLALALAAGVERAAMYKLIDTPGDYAANPEPFGLVREDGSRRPAFTTARVAIQILDDAQIVTWNEDHLVAQVVIQKPGQTVRMLWSRVPQPYIVTVPALAQSATLMDMWGNTSEVQAEGGVYRVGVYAGECQQTTGDYCMIGGPPVYLIENGDITGPMPVIEVTEPMPEISSTSPSAPGGVGRWIGIGIVVVILMAFELLLRRRFFRPNES